MFKKFFISRAYRKRVDMFAIEIFREAPGGMDFEKMSKQAVSFVKRIDAAIQERK